MGVVVRRGIGENKVIRTHYGGLVGWGILRYMVIRGEPKIKINSILPG